jgi:hypothetical protein
MVNTKICEKCEYFSFFKSSLGLEFIVCKGDIDNNWIKYGNKDFSEKFRIPNNCPYILEYILDDNKGG